jgi:phage major head subunit gpT-like protein
MIINHGNLQNLYNAINTAFNKGFVGAPSFWQKLAMKVPSQTRTNTYTWLGSTATIREWVGSRVVTKLSASGYSIENKKFEATVSVPREDIEDDTYGLHGPMFEKIGRDTAMFPDEQCFSLLARGFTTDCFDGQPFFDTDHPVGEAGLADVVSVSNMQAGTGTPWFLIDASQPIKPLIYQERMPFQFAQITDQNDERVFFLDEYIYGVRGRSNVGFGLCQCAYASKATLDATNYAAARAAMQTLKSDTGKPLGIKPTHLIVPPTLEEQGLGLLNTELLDGGGSNKWKGTAELIVTPYLG